MNRVLLGAVALLTLAACGGSTGPAGPQGDPGPAGPAGPAGSSGTTTSSVSGITPDHVFLARTAEVTISGFGTSWSSSTTVDFGAGITVKKLTVASPTALVANISIDKGATMGARDVTVKDAAGNATYSGAFKVISPIELTLQGNVAQGSIVTAHVKNLDLANPFDTTQGNLSLTAGTGVLGLAQNVTDFGAEFLIAIDVPAIGTQDIDVVSGAPNDPTDVEFPAPKAITIATRMATALTAGTPVNGNIMQAYDSYLYSYTPSSTALTILDFAATPSAPTANSQAAMYLLPKSGSWTNQLTGGTSFSWLSSATDPFYAVYADLSGATGAYTASVTATTPAANAAATASDGTRGTALTASALPFVLTSGALDAKHTSDWVSYKATAADVGKRFWVQTTSDFQTDIAITAYDSSGTNQVGQPVENLNLFTGQTGPDDGTIGPIPSAGTYYIVFAAGQAFDPAHGNYQGIIRTK